MVKSDIIEAVRSRTGLAKKDAERAVNTLFDVVADALSLGERVDVSGFGCFVIRDTPSRKVRHPVSRKTIHIPSKSKVQFKPSPSVVRSVGEAPAPKSK